MRDLQCLDGAGPPKLEVVGRLTPLGDDGEPIDDGKEGAGRNVLGSWRRREYTARDLPAVRR